MDPSQQAELTRVIVEYVRDGRYTELLTFLAIVYLPFVPAFWKEWRTRREVKSLYEARLGDKDVEIHRQAERIKELENAVLKTKRR